MAPSSDANAPGETGDYCPHFQRAIELIGRRWTGSILNALGNRALRFGEIKDAIPGLSDRLLSARLTELAAEHIVSRTTNHGEVRYSVTAKGSDLQPAFDELARWVARHGTGEAADRPGRRQVR